MLQSEQDTLELQPARAFSELFWKKVKDQLRIDILLPQKPKKILKLYPIEPEDMHINLEEVQKWSSNTKLIYDQIAENGFADFICNKEYIREAFVDINFDFANINEIDSDLLNFSKIEFLKLSFNKINKLKNIPRSLKELYLFQNSIDSISPKIRAENLLFLGLGHNLLNDISINCLGSSFPQLMCLDLCFNNLSQIDLTLKSISPLRQNLKMINLYGNPISLVNTYKKQVISEFPVLQYFDECKLHKEKEEKGTLKTQESTIKSSSQVNLDLVDDLNDAQHLNLQKFKFYVKVVTLDNPEGFCLDKSVYGEKFEQNPKKFQTAFWIQMDILGTSLSTKDNPKLFDSLFVDPEDRKRISFNFEYQNLLDISEKNRNFINEGFVVYLYKSEPIVQKIDDELKPVMDGEGFPTLQETVIGVVKISMQQWLKQTDLPRQILHKYTLFDQEVLKVPDFFYPVKDEAIALQRHQSVIQEMILKRDQINKPVEDTTGKKDAKKGKDKAKDDKKAAKGGKKGGKDQVEVVDEKMVEFLNWPVHSRNVVLTEEPFKLYLSQKDLLLAIKVEIQ